MAYPVFGCAGAVESETVTKRADQLEYRDGFDTDMFSLKWTDTWKRSDPSYCAQTYGIGKSTDLARNSLGVPLETVTLTEEEEVTAPHMISTQPGVSPVLGDKLTYTDGLIFFRMKRTLRIVGKGDPPAGMGVDDRGNTYATALNIMCAVGDTPVVTGTGGWYISSVELGKTVTDWQKFTIELIQYVGNTVENARMNMITPTLFETSELDAVSAWRKITKTTTLTFNNKAKVDETVELYDDSATP